MKKCVCILLISFILIFGYVGSNGVEFSGDAKSLILMEQNTGTVMYEMNADEALPPASVTKIMTALLVCEAIDGGIINLSDLVTASENAASMGGSQIYLETGEKMTVDDLLKSVMVASANDAAAALAEHVSGSLDTFVAKMNERAKELGMENTHFENTNGLDDSVTEHVISARDIAIMSRELLKHPIIFNYTTIWQDTVRDGKFTLTNTNRLIKFFDGANGLKTGSTSKAGFCISASAKRDKMQLIAVVMGASSRDIRNKTASEMLEYGFANYDYSSYDDTEIADIPIKCGVNDTICGKIDGYSAVLKKGAKLEQNIEINEEICAPLTIGDPIGKVSYTCDGEVLYECDITSCADVPKIGFLTAFISILKKSMIL